MVKKGGGICLYIKNTIPFETEWEGKVNCNNPNLEMLTVKLTIHNLRPFFVSAIYRPPSGSLLSFKQHMYDLLNVITLSWKVDVFIGGDFNIDYNRNNDNRKILREIEGTFGLAQLITKKTRPLYNNSTIDLIFVNNPDVTSSGTLHYNVSDHVPVYVIRKKIKIKTTKTEFFGRTYRNYSKDILAQKM